MKILNKFTIKNLKMNKKRTIVTIIGIMLSSALICGVVGLVSSFQKTLINFAIQHEGNYHTMFYKVPQENLKYIENNEKVESYFLSNELGWVKLEGSQNVDKPYLHVLEYDKAAIQNNGAELIEGRMPENSNEIVISEHINTNGRVNLKLGDVISLDIGERISKENKSTLYQDTSYLEGQEEIVNLTNKTYTIVGIIERLNYKTEKYNSPGYTVITYMQNIPNAADASVLYKQPTKYEENNEIILNATNAEYTDVNSELLRYQGALSDASLRVLYGIAAVVILIIMVSSIFVIRNSFSISVAEKNKQYGMMASIGATTKQIKKSVLFEGFVISLIAIPLGILLGIIAIIILLEVVNYLLGDMLNGIQFEYSLKIIPVLISIIISIITIYLSCIIPARKASKISPIESIRGNNDIKLKAKKVKTSKFIKKIFGIGGTIASKNLKRSKKKYRTTVISIVISIFIFISLSSFISYGNKVSSLYYTEFDFNIVVSNGNEDMYKKIIKSNNLNNYSYYYSSNVQLDVNKYATEFGKEYIQNSDINMQSTALMIYNNEYFKKYIKELGINQENYKDVAILIDEVVIYNADGTKDIEKIYNLSLGDYVNLKINNQDKNVRITKNTNKRPMGLQGTYFSSGMIIVSQDFIEGEVDDYCIEKLLIQSENPTELENVINDLKKEDSGYSGIQIYNYEKIAEQENRMVLVIAIFLYGFITVITLIGVTNIFNTITTNMILRSKEFAMLKSVGMTTKEFNRMIRLESILYGLKSLIIGIPLGIIGSYFIYKSFAESVDVGYNLPMQAILITIVFVFIIIGFTMKYSLNKINKQNIIETIRKENI